MCLDNGGHFKSSNRYTVHPLTGKPIVGYRIPFWNEIRTMVKELGLVVPELRYTGWDVAITSKGPILIEGNHRGMFDVQQQADQVGKRELYNRVIKGLIS